MNLFSTLSISCSRRWGEPEKEKCPVNIFPGEPTDEGIYAEETLNHGLKELIGIYIKIAMPKGMTIFMYPAEEGT